MSYKYVCHFSVRESCYNIENIIECNQKYSIIVIFYIHPSPSHKCSPRQQGFSQSLYRANGGAGGGIRRSHSSQQFVSHDSDGSSLLISRQNVLREHVSGFWHSGPQFCCTLGLLAGHPLLSVSVTFPSLQCNFLVRIPPHVLLH